MNDRTEALGKGAIGKLLLRFSIPAIIGMVVNALYTVVDRIYIGRGVGSLGIAGATVGFPIVNFGLALSLLTGIGTTALVSIRLGEKKTEEAEKIMGAGFAAGIVLALAMTVAGILFLTPLLRLFGASKDVLPYAVSYMRIILLGNVFMTMGMALNSLIRAEGNPLKAMLTMIIGAVLNVILDPIFIFVFHWGIRGAAIATVLSQMTTAVWVLSHFISGKSVLKLRLENIRFRPALIKNLMYIGMSPFAMHTAGSLLNAVLTRRLVRYGGDVAVSGMGIIISLSMLMMMPVLGINQGAQPIIGYNFGARRFDRVKKTLALTLVSSTLLLSSIYVLINISPRFVISFFNPEDTALIDFGARAIRTFLLFIPLIGVQMASGHYFMSTGNPKMAMVLTLSRQVLFLIPLVLVLPLFFGLSGILYAGPIADGLSLCVAGILLYREIAHLGRRHTAESMESAGPRGETGLSAPENLI
jgi:putative MATE family efflux protein